MQSRPVCILDGDISEDRSCHDLALDTVIDNNRVFAYGPGHSKTCLMPYANKGADQPAHPRSLVSTFVVHCIDSMICILAISKVSRF